MTDTRLAARTSHEPSSRHATSPHHAAPLHAAPHHHAPARRPLWGSGLLPGLVLTFVIAGTACLLRQVPGFDRLSPLILAIVIGTGFHNTVGTPARCRAGVLFSLRRLLRLGIILLGLQLTFLQVIAVGGRGIAVILLTVAATFLVTTWLGQRLGVDRKLAQLIAAGTSICGASAVIATNAVTEGSDEDVAYAVACVTIFGSLAMFLYPALDTLLRLEPLAYGLWAGASIHEIAQVVAAAFQAGKEAGDFATIAKLSRIILLAPLVILLGELARRRTRRHAHGAHGQKARAAAPLPWFVLGFLAMIAVNSLAVVPQTAKPAIVHLTTFLLTVALAAMGLETDIRKLKARGWTPLLLGAASWLFIGGFSLGLVALLGT